MSAVKREPAIKRSHPAEDLPSRPQRPAAAPSGGAATAGEEKLTIQHNVRIRPSTKDRLTRFVDWQRYETGDRTISISSLTDDAIDEYLNNHWK